MRPLTLLIVCLAAGSSAAIATSSTAGFAVVPKPDFPPPLRNFTPSAGPQLRLVSAMPRDPSVIRSPGYGFPPGAYVSIEGVVRSRAFGQPGTVFGLYGTGILVAYGWSGGVKYTLDLTSFGFPPKSVAPRAYGPQEVVWARQIGNLLIVETAHLGYAKDSANRNGYLTAIDLDTGEVRWRSPSLVANARNFLVLKGMIVSGYGFTAEKDWLYLLDVKTGRVRDRLALPSMAEEITRRGDRIVVRCYDAKVVVRLA